MNYEEIYNDGRYKRLRLRALRHERKQEARERRRRRQQFLRRGYDRQRVRFPFNLLDGSIQFILRAIEYLVRSIVTRLLR
jgi:hypothetical protein